MRKRGFFSMVTVRDLFLKLERDLRKLEASPLDVDMAFNFFITAEHILDWKYPIDPTRQHAERDNSVLLQIVSHLANGAKHFEVQDKRHTSVDRTDKISYGGTYYGDSYYGDGYYGSIEALGVALDGEAASQFGAWIEVVPLARLVLQYWKEALTS